MVEQISGNQGRLIADALLTRRSDAAENLEGVASQASAPQNASATVLAFLDNADVSAKARRLLEASRFGRLAMESPDADVSARADLVAQLRSMVEHGKLSDLTRRYDNAVLAQSLLNSPTAAFLR
ncbi:MAG: hypothetical protein IPK79_11115 [Vampirovibrionales bacterium]|nr:hypothetical protein [Vampirovibrionales bacterium]